MPVRFRRLTAALGSVLWAALASDAFAQGALPARILQIEDARELSVASQAVLSEGLKDPSPRVRAQAVRAMGRFESPALVGQIVPLLGDADPGVRHAAAVAAANAAKVFPGQAIEALDQGDGHGAAGGLGGAGVLAGPDHLAGPGRLHRGGTGHRRRTAHRGTASPGGAADTAGARGQPTRCGSKARRAGWRHWSA